MSGIVAAKSRSGNEQSRDVLLQNPGDERHATIDWTTNLPPIRHSAWPHLHQTRAESPARSFIPSRTVAMLSRRSLPASSCSSSTKHQPASSLAVSEADDVVSVSSANTCSKSALALAYSCLASRIYPRPMRQGTDSG